MKDASLYCAALQWLIDALPLGQNRIFGDSGRGPQPEKLAPIAEYLRDDGVWELSPSEAMVCYDAWLEKRAGLVEHVELVEERNVEPPWRTDYGWELDFDHPENLPRATVRIRVRDARLLTHIAVDQTWESAPFR